MALDLSGLSGLTESFADGKPVRKILDIDISLISPDPLQPRKEFNEDKLQDLAASIGEYGLIQPIVVRKQGEGYVIVAGERRYRACQILGKESVSCILQEKGDPLALSYIQITENIKRENLSVSELAESICLLIQNGELQSSIAQKLGLSKSLISEYASWKDAPEFLKIAVKEKRIESIQAVAELFRKWKKAPVPVEDYVRYAEKITRKQAERFEPSEEVAKKITEEETENSFTGETSTKPDEENFNDPIAQKDFLETEESLSHEQNEELKDGQGECLDKKTIAEESHAENEELFPGAKIDASCYQPLEDENNIDNEQEENSEEAFKETRCENSFDDVDAYRECFPDEEKDEQLYKKPVIFCLVDGRECELLYKRKASDGIVCVKFEDGSEQEVIAEKVQLNRICES